MIEYAQALAQVLAAAAPLPGERVASRDAIGRVLADAVHATEWARAIRCAASTRSRPRRAERAIAPSRPGPAASPTAAAAAIVRRPGLLRAAVVPGMAAHGMVKPRQGQHRVAQTTLAARGRLG